MTTPSYEDIYLAYEKAEEDLLVRIGLFETKHNDLIKESKVQYSADDDLLHSHEIQDVSGGGVRCGWSVNWSYGGHAEGTCFFSAEELGGDWERLATEKAQKFIDIKKGTAKAKRDDKEEKERATYEHLKKKFEGKA